MLHYANLSLILYSIVKLFDVSHDFLPLTNAELSTLKQVRFFGPPSTDGFQEKRWNKRSDIQS